MGIMEPTTTSARLVRERQTIEKMAFLYCQKYHHTPKGILCQECQELVDYAFERLRRCPFQEDKPTCAKCTVHCYKPVMRQKVREMMRHAGPLMLLHHPLLTFFHLVIDNRRKPPALKRRPAQK
jgi:Nitrous oxide-stimulated promoter